MANICRDGGGGYATTDPPRLISFLRRVKHPEHPEHVKHPKHLKHPEHLEHVKHPEHCATR